jgi:hypothetical protein
MKVRKGFVSNSSSSSFILFLNKGVKISELLCFNQLVEDSPEKQLIIDFIEKNMKHVNYRRVRERLSSMYVDYRDPLGLTCEEYGRPSMEFLADNIMICDRLCDDGVKDIMEYIKECERRDKFYYDDLTIEDKVKCIKPFIQKEYHEYMKIWDDIERNPKPQHIVLNNDWPTSSSNIPYDTVHINVDHLYRKIKQTYYANMDEWAKQEVKHLKKKYKGMDAFVLECDDHNDIECYVIYSNILDNINRICISNN